MKVAAIFMIDGTGYIVGNTPADLVDIAGDDIDARVTAIDFHRTGNYYNKGFQTGRPGYSVKINNTDIRRLIPEEQVKQIYVDIEKAKSKKDDGAVIPDLPDSEQKDENAE
jgi:hypothetical protein